MNYCICCGRKVEEINKELKKLPFVEVYKGHKRRRSWEGHIQVEGNDFFYEATLFVDYCSNCGAKLSEDDLKSFVHTVGFVGSERAQEEIVVGYKCPVCGYEEDF